MVERENTTVNTEADMMNSTAEAEYARARTSVWWDIENCPVPKSWDARVIAQNLSSALMKMNYCGPLSISSYGNTNLIPNSVQQALSSTGIALNHVPSGRKDASDKKILVDMFLWVVENPAPANLMLISGDGDFSDALHRLRMRRYNILLAHPKNASASLVASAKTTWLWRSLMEGGSSLTHCGSSSLLDSTHLPRDSEIASQAVSESRKPMDLGSGSSRVAGNKLKGIYAPKASTQLLQQETKRKKLMKNCNGTSESTWLCKLCNVTCKSFEIFTTHLSGKEHADQWDLKQNLTLSGEPENMAASPSECHEKDVEMTNKIIKAEVETSAHCGLRSEVCPGQASLDSYPKNAATVKKQGEALIDANSIEESVQDNELQSWDPQKSIKSLEKQNKELTETSTTSERSCREFWQDFKETLESDGVSPLNVDCVFSELSRDFRVPKEVRECFDTNLKKLEPSQNEIATQKLDGMPNQVLEMESGDPENAPAVPSEHTEEDVNKKKKKKNKRQKKKSTVIGDGAETYVCSFCSVICDHPAVFESHIKGRKHAATIKKHTEALLDDKKIQEEIIRDNGHTIEEFWFLPGEASENIDCLQKQYKEMGGRCEISDKNVEELCQAFEGVESEEKYFPNTECIFTELIPEFSSPKEVREGFNAIIEKLELSQDAYLTRELENIPNQNLEMNSGKTESNSARASEHPEEYMDKKKKKKKEKATRDKAEPEAYVCSICSVICDCPIVFETHLMGRRHSANVKKHAEILEESLQEKDNPRDVMEKIRYQPKEAEENIKNVCQISKERVEKESKSLPNAEHFITERNLEFQEPKEASNRERLERLKLSLEEVTSKQKPREDKSKSERVATEIRVCDWCNVTCTSQGDFDSHLIGKKHAATVKKHVATVKKHVATVKKHVDVVKKQAGT